MITGYNDNFNRTVASGFGTATSGQVYSLQGTASQYSVTPGTANILPTATAERYGWVDRQTTDIDITGQVSLTGIPASNLMTVGFIFKRADVNNYYNATMLVATGGAISLRFSKGVGGGLSTVATVATGLTYVANVVYNLRVVSFWSNALQAHVLRSKLWVVGGTEPGGWMATATDATLTQYVAGNQAGPFARDEQASPGTITAKIQNVVAKTYGLAIPAGTDPMCADPSVAYPQQTVIQSLAVGADAAMTTLDPRISLAGLFPRVRVSASNFTVSPTTGSYNPVYNTTEFNIGTSTNLGYVPTSLLLPTGIWMVQFEFEMQGVLSLTDGQLQITGGPGFGGGPRINMRINATNANDNGRGGSGRVSYLCYSTDPASTVTVTSNVVFSNTLATYTVKYAALSAFKISDYFA